MSKTSPIHPPPPPVGDVFYSHHLFRWNVSYPLPYCSTRFIVIFIKDHIIIYLTVCVLGVGWCHGGGKRLANIIGNVKCLWQVWCKILAFRIGFLATQFNTKYIFSMYARRTRDESAHFWTTLVHTND